MTTSVEKKQILEKASIGIELETAEEVQAFKNMLAFAENSIYERLKGYDLKLEKKIVSDLRKHLS